MAEYFIIAVAYEAEENHIEWAFVVRNPKENSNPGGWLVQRGFVHDLIALKAASFKTALFNKETRSFDITGSDVHIYGDDFIKTDPDYAENNNLENLPRFIMPDAEIDKTLDSLLKGIISSNR